MIVIDSQSRQPIYEQIVEKVENLIAAGALAPGSQLPSIRALAVELSINPNTIQKAYGILEQRGDIYPVKGKGNFVANQEQVLARMRDSCFRQFEENVQYGKELGISKEAFAEKIEKCYKEDRYDINNRG